MKKTIILTALLVLVASSAMAAALSAGAVSDAAAVIRGGATAAEAAAASAPLGKLSTGVSLGPQHANSGYAIATKHVKGSKLFGTAHDATAIFWKVSAPATMTTAEVPGSASNAAFATGWTVM